MTGTADTEAEEFAKIYNLDVRVIPTNRPMVRKDVEDVVYKTEREKFEAVGRGDRGAAREGPAGAGGHGLHREERGGRAASSRSAGVPHNVLNAKQHQREADIVAQAGRKGAVTISTNMAGRGTDILLGGNPEVLAKSEVGPPPEPPSAGRGRQPLDLTAYQAALAEHEQQLRRSAGEVQGADRGRARGGDRAGRPLHPRHRAPRVAPHRQPAAWPRRPPGRPGRQPLLPVARRRPDAHLRVRAHHRR